MSLSSQLDVPVYGGNGIDVISQSRKSIQNLNRFSSRGKIAIDDKMLEEFKKQEESMLKKFKKVSETNEEYNELAERLQSLDVFKASEYQIVNTEDDEEDSVVSEQDKKTMKILGTKIPKKVHLLKKAVMNSIKKHDKSDLNKTNNRYSAEFALTGKSKQERKRTISNVHKKKQEISDFLNSPKTSK